VLCSNGYKSLGGEKDDSLFDPLALRERVRERG
jgi:hypothetical protein